MVKGKPRVGDPKDLPKRKKKKVRRYKMTSYLLNNTIYKKP